MMRSVFKPNILVAIIGIFLVVKCAPPATKAMKKGLQKQQQGEYNYSIEFFKSSLEKGGPKAKLNFLIGENYRLTNRISEAGAYYAKAVNAGSKEDKVTYYLAQAQKSQGNYVDAKLNFEKYLANGLNKALLKQAKLEVDFLENVNALTMKQSFFQIQNMGSDLNTEGPEYAPLYRNDQLIYTASNNQFQYTAIGSGFTDIYTFKFDGSTEYSGVKKEYGEKINQNKTHEACPAISPDGGYIVFVRSNDGKRKGAADTDLYFTELRDEQWSNPVILTPVSDPRYWESTPAFSNDGKTLYFASNRKGGYGGVDLYKSVLTDTAGWSAPVNLGPKINTIGNELFPSIRKDDRFYFASDGHPGLGGLDIFKVLTDSLGEISLVENMGPNVNTNSDDFGITFKDFASGYFSSNREGGKGDDDIYEFKIVIPPPPPIIKVTKAYLVVNATTQDIKTQNIIALDSTTLSLSTDTLSNGLVLISDSSGTTTFPIDTNSTYFLLAEKGNYFSNQLTFSTKGKEYRRDSISPALINLYYKATINLQKIQIGREIVLEHIYYDYNKSDIRLDAEPDLKLLIDFMKKNTGISIELGSHTDSRGNDQFNLKLSQARAKSAVAYIVQNGVDPARIRPVGYGETKHKIKDAKTEDEHQVNRRTEFRIVEVKD